MAWPNPFPEAVADGLASMPLSEVQKVENLEAAALAGSAWARQRLREIEALSITNALASSAARAALRRLYLELGA